MPDRLFIIWRIEVCTPNKIKPCSTAFSAPVRSFLNAFLCGRSFLHPEDSDNAELHQFVREEEIRERDTDGDGKLSFVEFLGGMYDALRDLKVSLGSPPDTPPRTAVLTTLRKAVRSPHPF